MNAIAADAIAMCAEHFAFITIPAIFDRYCDEDCCAHSEEMIAAALDAACDACLVTLPDSTLPCDGYDEKELEFFRTFAAAVQQRCAAYFIGYDESHKRFSVRVK